MVCVHYGRYDREGGKHGIDLKASR